MSAKGLDRMRLTERRILVGQEYKPRALLREMESIPVSISDAITGLKKKDLSKLPDM